MWLEQLAQDVRYGLRRLRRDPLVTLVVSLTLAVGIGLSTALFSVFNAVLLRPIDYPASERLVWLSTVGPEGGPGVVIGPDFADWRAQATSFEQMVAYGSIDETSSGGDGASRVRVAAVTDDFWELSGARAAAGRLPAAGERGVAVLSRAFANRQFPGADDLIGRPVTLDGRTLTIVGVLPDDFRFRLPPSPWLAFSPREVDVYRSLQINPSRAGQVELFNVVGRLRPGVSLVEARAELDIIRARIDDAARARAAQDGGMFPSFALRMVPMIDELIGSARLALELLLAAVGFVLLIACANAANVLLARASVRQREIAIRASIGAGRARVFRQLLIESLVLAGLGGVAGVALARLAIDAILRINAAAIPRLDEAAIDSRVLAVAVIASLATGLLFGLAPALALWRVNPTEALKDGGRTATASRERLRARMLLVAAETALALLLVVGAGLMLKSAWRLNATTPGFDPDRVLTARVMLSGRQYSSRDREIAFANDVLQRLQRVPGVDAVSLSTHGYGLTSWLQIDGEPPPTPEMVAQHAPIVVNATSPALARVLGLRVVRGRWMEENEAAAVLNETLARRHFGDRDPLGHRIRVRPDAAVTIVGVIADHKHARLDAAAEAEYYIPFSQDDGLFGFTLLVRTSGDPLALAGHVRSAVAGVDKTQAVDEIRTLEQLLADSIAPRRLNLFLFGVFGATALLLALVGIYGSMAYTVTQRVQEISVRVALGARPADVVRLVLRQAIWTTAAGIVIGLAAAVALTRLMTGLLYEVEPTDAQTFILVTLALAATSLAACFIPAVKAALADPVLALRHE